MPRGRYTKHCLRRPFADTIGTFLMLLLQPE